MTRRTDQQKVEKAIEWFTGISRERQIKAVRQLFLYAFTSEWLGIYDDPEELAAEEGQPIEKYLAPYDRNCGESLA